MDYHGLTMDYHWTTIFGLPLKVLFFRESRDYLFCWFCTCKRVDQTRRNRLRQRRRSFQRNYAISDEKTVTEFCELRLIRAGRGWRYRPGGCCESCRGRESRESCRGRGSGLEARTPFLDMRFVDFYMRLPPMVNHG